MHVVPDSCLQVIAFLLAHGAVVNVKDRWGNTPYDDAQRGDFDAICGYLDQASGR